MAIMCRIVDGEFICMAKNARQQLHCAEAVIDSVDKDCRMMNRDLTCSIGSQIECGEANLVFEDDLPDDITDEQYDWWYDRSYVNGVRIGPKIHGW